MSQHDFDTNQAYEQLHVAGVSQILKGNAMYIANVELATKEADTRQATDMVFKITGGDIAVRVRRYKSHRDKFRDLTIRAMTKGGGKTEIQKLLEGFGDWYLYAWANKQDELTEYMLLDIPAIRSSGLLEKKRKKIPNGDGTGFIYITLRELHDAKAIVSAKILSKGYWHTFERAEIPAVVSRVTTPALKLADAA